MRNLEIKVSAPMLGTVREKLQDVGDAVGVLTQKDTYFLIGEKRLKLREEQGGAYIVYYVRPDTIRSKFSKYYILHIPPQVYSPFKKILSKILRVKVVVDKRRELFVYKNTRIHLDTVRDLGTYVELETVFSEGKRDADLRNEHEFLIRKLGLDALEAISQSYSDLLNGKP